MKFPLSFSLILSQCFLLLGIAHAQTLINGQLFTKALAIVNAPAINSQLNSGGTMALSVDVSGNGRLQSLAESSLDSLHVFLVSDSLNLTVTSGSDFLSGEQGSTVKHLNWVIPSCVLDGPYNLTFYESGRIDGNPYDSITPVILSIRNPNPSKAECTENINDVLQQPQADSSPETNPLLSTSTTTPTSPPRNNAATALNIRWILPTLLSAWLGFYFS